MKKFTQILVLLLLTNVAFGQDEATSSPLEISGFVDAYYGFHSDGAVFPTSFTETDNSFTPGMANVVLSKEAGKVGFVADLAVGPRAEVANGYTGTTLAAIKQLYVTYSPSDKLTFTLGNFGTFVGYEVIDAPANFNYSTSYLFSNGPFYHTGLKVDYALAEGVGVMLGLFNDTDSKVDEVSGKHFGAQVSLEKGGFAGYLNFLTGQDDDTQGASSNSSQIDFTGTYAVSDAFNLGLNASQKSFDPEVGDGTAWAAAALYANYSISESFALGLRGEYVMDEDGEMLGVADNNVTSLTLSGNIKLGDLTIIPEFRIDSADQDTYVDEDGAFTDSATGFILGAVYSF